MPTADEGDEKVIDQLLLSDKNLADFLPDASKNFSLDFNLLSQFRCVHAILLIPNCN